MDTAVDKLEASFQIISSYITSSELPNLSVLAPPTHTLCKAQAMIHPLSPLLGSEEMSPMEFPCNYKISRSLRDSAAQLSLTLV